MRFYLGINNNYPIPKKCIGKNITLAPINNNQNCMLAKLLL